MLRLPHDIPCESEWGVVCRGGWPKLYGYGSPLRMKLISLEGERVDSVRAAEKQPEGYSPLYDIRQRFVMFSVGAQKPEHDDLGRTHELRPQCQLVGGSLADDR